MRNFLKSLKILAIGTRNMMSLIITLSKFGL